MSPLSSPRDTLLYVTQIEKVNLKSKLNHYRDNFQRIFKNNLRDFDALQRFSEFEKGIL